MGDDTGKVAEELTAKEPNLSAKENNTALSGQSSEPGQQSGSSDELEAQSVQPPTPNPVQFVTGTVSSPPLYYPMPSRSLGTGYFDFDLVPILRNK
jgi:hypothetical protein